MTDTTALIQQIQGDAMTTWSESRRKDFVKLFEQRTKVSQYLLKKTADVMLESAHRKGFISSKHIKMAGKPGHYFAHHSYSYGDYDNYNQVGGRPTTELFALADQKAKEVLKNLPPLKKAVSIVDPETSKMIEEKEKMEAKGQRLTDQLEEISGDIVMADLDQSMTIGDFRAMIKSRDRKRRRLISNLEELGKELSQLDEQVSKRLYSGIPGLSDAVVKTYKSFYEKATALDQMNRRVGEKVMFGDSESAMEILKSFEKDEAEVSDEIKAEFKAALTKLKLVGAKKKAPAKTKAK